MIIREIHSIFDLIFDLILLNYIFNFHRGTTPGIGRRGALRGDVRRACCSPRVEVRRDLDFFEAVHVNTDEQPELRGVEDLAERDELRGLRRRAVLDLDPAVLADAPLPPVRDVQHLRHEAPVLDGDLGREDDRGDA